MLSVIVLLLVIGLLLNHIRGKQRSRDDSIVQHEHALESSDKMKRKWLANVELESGKLKQKQELLALNRRLREQLNQKDVLVDQLTKDRKKLHTSIEEVSDSRNEYHNRSHALILELKDMDGQLEIKQNMVLELQKNLTEEQNESRRLKTALQNQIYELQENLSLSEKAILELKKSLEEHRKSLEEYKKSLEKHKKALDECDATLQQERVANETNVRKMQDSIRKHQQESHVLGKQLSEKKQMTTELEDRLNEQKQKYKNDMLSMEKRFQECKLQVSVYKQTVDELKKEKVEVVKDHKVLVGRFEDSLRDLSKCIDEIQKVVTNRTEHKILKKELSEVKQKYEELKNKLKRMVT